MDYEKIVYTDDDVIESKDDERVESLIGKKVYASWSRDMCLYRANHSYIDLQFFLIRTDPENTIAPFVVAPVNHQSTTNTATEPLNYNMPYLIGVKSERV